jgi:hypothetical protein
MISPIPPTVTRVLFRNNKIMSCSVITAPRAVIVTIKIKTICRTNTNGAQNPHPKNIKCKTPNQNNTKSSSKIINFSTRKPPVQPAAATTATNNKANTTNSVRMTKMTQRNHKPTITITEQPTISIMKSTIWKVLQAVMRTTVTIRWNQT